MTLPRLSVAFLFLGLCGCASHPQQQILTPFFDQDFQTWKQTGPYTVTGQAFYKLPDGRVLTCAGETVSLIPAVGYNTELEQLLQTGKGYPPNYDRHARKYDYTAVCDSTGKFSFENIPALNWIVAVHISWQEASTWSSIPVIGDPSTKGGYLFTELQVGDNHTKVLLTNPDFVADQN